MTSEALESFRTTVHFDPHDAAMPETSREVLADLRSRCPVAHSEAHGGFWVISGHDEVQRVARDDATYSSENDFEARQGISMPGALNRAGIIETDPPRFKDLRRAFVPWFAPNVSRARRADVERLTDHCIDAIIESGRGDLTEDVASRVPALLTMQFLGFAASEAVGMADLFHRLSYTPPNTPEREQLQLQMQDLGALLLDTAARRREGPGEDFLSFLATFEIDGAAMALEEVAENAFLVLAGGVDTTTALLSNTFLHLDDEPQIRARLLAEPAFMDTAFEEYLRYYCPVQGLARTVTTDHELNGQLLRADDRLFISWASANQAEDAFANAATVDLTRSPNRHLSFGVGLHRCLGAHLAKVIWETVVRGVLTRLPDYRIDHADCQRFPTIGAINGWVCTPATFTPGVVVGATLD